MDKLGPYELNQIITGDARELAEAIPDNSIDLIFTDPVYWQIEDYKWVAQLAARVLKPNKSCLVWGGNLFVEDYILAIKSAGLKFKGNLTLFMGGPGGTPMGKNGNLIVKTTPCLWYTKGDMWPLEKMWNISITTTLTNLTKNHKWNKDPGTVLRWLAAFSREGEIVLDCFCGGATIPSACKMLIRNYLAFEIDPITAEIAREKVINTQAPLTLLSNKALQPTAQPRLFVE